MNIVFTHYGWEWRIQRGRLSAELLRPIHPLHWDVAFFAGWKFVVIILWLPLAALLAWVFKPDLNPSLLDVGVFFLAIWGAYLIRTMLLSLLGMITFWTTRVSAIFELFFALELVLSGRLVPMSLMPEWVQQISSYLPFKWTFQYPIEALIANLSPQELLGGLGVQALWILIGVVAVNIMWKFGIQRFSAVGN
jgi:ABC-2 type transport system permease protein